MKQARDRRGRFTKRSRGQRPYTTWDIIVTFAIMMLPIMAVIHYEYNELVYPAEASAPEQTIEQLVEVEPKEVRIQVLYDTESVKREIEEVFGENHIMLKVAKCESEYKQFAFNPTNNSNDRGIFQISEKYHGVGDEMYDVKKNIAYAKKLYDRNGLKDWVWSKHCWNK